VTLSVDQITHLLNGLKSLPPLQKQEQTFMEIAGYPHFENVCSNILQFYLQPSNEHGFGSLLLDSLFRLINENVVIDGHNVDVRREESTYEGKRIDLIIESEGFVLGIENKIFADARHNPFCKYAKHLDELRKDRQVYKVLLSVFPIDTSKLKLCGFKPITYQLLFEKVIANIGSYFLTGREPHTIFFRDFIKTIQNLQEATSMDESRLLYFADNHESISTLFAEVIEMQKDMRKKVKELDEVVRANPDFSDIESKLPEVVRADPDFSDIEPKFPDKLNKFNKSEFWFPSASNRLVAGSWYRFYISDSLSIQLDVRLTPKGWYLQFSNHPRANHKEVEDWANARSIKFELSKSNALIYKGENDSLPYSTSPVESGKWVVKMLKKLTHS
jgi:hypothetical protein